MSQLHSNPQAQLRHWGTVALRCSPERSRVQAKMLRIRPIQGCWGSCSPHDSAVPSRLESLASFCFLEKPTVGHPCVCLVFRIAACRKFSRRPLLNPSSPLTSTPLRGGPVPVCIRNWFLPHRPNSISFWLEYYFIILSRSSFSSKHNGNRRRHMPASVFQVAVDGRCQADPANTRYPSALQLQAVQ